MKVNVISTGQKFASRNAQICPFEWILVSFGGKYKNLFKKSKLENVCITKFSFQPVKMKG